MGITITPTNTLKIMDAFCKMYLLFFVLEPLDQCVFFAKQEFKSILCYGGFVRNPFLKHYKIANQLITIEIHGAKHKKILLRNIMMTKCRTDFTLIKDNTWNIHVGKFAV